MKTLKNVAVVVAATGILGFAVSSYAADVTNVNKEHAQFQQHKHHGDMQGHRGEYRHEFGAALGLTDAQKEAVKAARVTNEPVMKALYEKIKVARKALHDGVKGNVDDAMLAKLSNDVATLEGQGELMRAKRHRDFINLLTPEQKQKLETFETERKNAPRWKDGPRKDGHIKAKQKAEAKAQ